jgi:hypothetical protein
MSLGIVRSDHFGNTVALGGCILLTIYIPSSCIAVMRMW